MHTDGPSHGMDLGEVPAVLADLTEGGCAVWVAGGWGVDALIGRQTRVHRDLDLALNACNETVALRVLECRGYGVETDWRPVRVELIAEGRGWVDVAEWGRATAVAWRLIGDRWTRTTVVSLDSNLRVQVRSEPRTSHANGPHRPMS